MPRPLIAALSLLILLAGPSASAQSLLEDSPKGHDTTTPRPIAENTSASDTPPDSSSPKGLSENSWHSPPDLHEQAGDYVGADNESFRPYERESVVYRMAPPIRYNRVEGVVMGIRREPLQRSSTDRARIFGQLAYAVELRDLRYSVGVESKLYSTRTSGLKLGALYQKQTLSPDRWKTSYLENSLASLGFRHDFFDYYEAEGLSLYAIQALPLSLRLTGGVRTETHRSLSKHTNWSVFKSNTFRANPAIDGDKVQEAFASLTGGRVRDLDDLPTGGTFRLAASVADQLKDSRSFTRYEADGRLYLPLTIDTRLALRLRGGYATSEAPRHMQFTLGGIGSVRSYAQNRFRGTRMLLTNAEYLIEGATVFDAVLDDLFLAGLLDAGWVGGPSDSVRLDDVLPAAGVGIGLDERRIRLDVSWPLRDGPGAGSRPSLWLRIAPNF